MPVIQVKVRPGSRESSLCELDGGLYLASVKSPPVDGKANEELIALVARHFKVPRAAVTIRSGAGARVKRVAVALP